MNYELAKLLKDNGFPDNPKHYSERPKMGIDSDGEFRNFAPYDCYVPTLEELIEECGDKFDKLERNLNNVHNVIEWYAYSERLHPPKLYYVTGFGLTPEEAVARLWLELNKKIEN